jgi:hypothetical protein
MKIDNPIFIEWFEHEEMIENEQAIVTSSGNTTLKYIPSEYWKIQIDGFYEVKKNKTIKLENEFICDYRTGQLTFHSSKIGQKIIINKYFAIGLIFYPASRIYDSETGEPINPDSVKTLQDYINSVRPYGYKGDYNSEETYQSDSMVSYDHTLYRCKKLSQNILPTDTEHWQPMISVKQEANYAIEQGNYAKEQGDILNTEITNFNIKGEYDSSVTYYPKNIITYDNCIYVNKVMSIGNLPTDTNYWQPMLSIKEAVEYATL